MLSGPSDRALISLFALAEVWSKSESCYVVWYLMAFNPIVFPFGFRLARYNCCLWPGGPANDFSKPMGYDKIMRLLRTCW